MNLNSKYLTNIPLLALVVANLIPFWGVVFWDWDAFNVVLLYWSENIVVGFYNILKMAFAKVSWSAENLGKLFEKVPKPAENIGKLFMIPFFMIHYGGFCAVHGLFILTLFRKGNGSFMKHAYSIMSQEMRYALVALFVSHGVSFVYNYMIKGEYAKARPDKLMRSPYSRIAIMHMAVLFGAFLTMALGSPVGILILLVTLKISLDVIFHLRQHKKHQAKAASA